MTSPRVSIRPSFLRGVLTRLANDLFDKTLNKLSRTEICILGLHVHDDQNGAELSDLVSWTETFGYIINDTKMPLSTLKTVLSRAVKSGIMHKDQKLYVLSPPAADADPADDPADDPVNGIDTLDLLALVGSTGRRSSNGTTTTSSSSQSLSTILYSARSFFFSNKLAISEFKQLMATIANKSSSFRDVMTNVFTLSQNLKKNGYSMCTDSEIDSLLSLCPIPGENCVVRDLFCDASNGPSLVVRSSCPDFSWENFSLLDYDGQLQTNRPLVPFLLHFLDLRQNTTIKWEDGMVCVSHDDTAETEIISDLCAWFLNVNKLDGTMGRIMTTTWTAVTKSSYIAALKDELATSLFPTGWFDQESPKNTHQKMRRKAVSFLRRLRVLGFRTAREDDIDDVLDSLELPADMHYTVRDMMSFGLIDDCFVVRSSPGCIRTTLFEPDQNSDGDREKMAAVETAIKTACNVWEDTTYEPENMEMRCEGRTIFRTDGTKCRFCITLRDQEITVV